MVLDSARERELFARKDDLSGTRKWSKYNTWYMFTVGTGFLGDTWSDFFSTAATTTNQDFLCDYSPEPSLSFCTAARLALRPWDRSWTRGVHCGVVSLDVLWMHTFPPWGPSQLMIQLYLNYQDPSSPPSTVLATHSPSSTIRHERMNRDKKKQRTNEARHHFTGLF